MAWIAALVFASILQLLVREPAFFSGDGGAKFLMTRQLAAGSWTREVLLPAEESVARLWDRGHYPLAPPFAYEIAGHQIFGLPLPFPAASAPFYLLLGYRGLYAIPFLSLVALAHVVRVLARRIGLAPAPAALFLSSLLLASFVPLYSAMFWEHLPATVLAFAGVAGIVSTMTGPVRARSMAAAGALAGLSSWLRPEGLLLLAAASLVWLPMARSAGRMRAWAAFTLSGGFVAGAFLALNGWLYGHPLGAHAFQVLLTNEPLSARIARGFGLMPRLAGDLLAYAPMAALVPVLGLRAFLTGRTRADDIVRFASTLAGLFLLFLPFVVPNEGGLQWGPRFAMPIVPVACLASAVGLDRGTAGGGGRSKAALGIVAAGLLVLGLVVNGILGTRELARNYASRVLPAIEAARRSQPTAVVVSDMFIAQEMAALSDTKRFIRIAGDGAPAGRNPLIPLAEALYEEGIDRFLLVVGDYSGARAVESPFALESRGVHVRAVPLGKHGWYYHLYDCTSTAPGAGAR
jgi:hypothetical protein